MSNNTLPIILGFLLLASIIAFPIIIAKDINCDKIDKNTCSIMLKDSKILTLTDYNQLNESKASELTCSSLPGYKLSTQPEFDKLNEAKASETTCSSLQGYKLLTQPEFDKLDTNQASPTTCASLKGYHLMSDTDISIPSGYKLIKKDTYTKMLSQHPKAVIQNKGADNKCITFDDSGMNISYTDCNRSGENANQLVYYDFERSAFKSLDGKCLDDGGGIGNFYLNPVCSDQDSQKFQVGISSKRITSKSDANKCLDSNAGLGLRYEDCKDNDDNQTWTPLRLIGLG